MNVNQVCLSFCCSHLFVCFVIISCFFGMYNYLLNQACAWFLEIVFMKTSVCVCVCVCVCVSAPQAIKNHSREMKPE